jgi:hypothetical protein
MKQKEAILLSMLVLAIVLVGAQTHALLMPTGDAYRSSGDGLKASVVETLEYLNDLRPNALPAVPGMRDVPDLAIN